MLCKEYRHYHREFLRGRRRRRRRVEEKGEGIKEGGIRGIGREKKGKSKRAREAKKVGRESKESREVKKEGGREMKEIRGGRVGGRGVNRIRRVRKGKSKIGSGIKSQVEERVKQEEK
jgi:hypothetical protein